MATSLYNSDKYPRFHAQYFPQRLGVFLSVFSRSNKKAPFLELDSLFFFKAALNMAKQLSDK